MSKPTDEELDGVLHGLYMAGFGAGRVAEREQTGIRVASPNITEAKATVQALIQNAQIDALEKLKEGRLVLHYNRDEPPTVAEIEDLLRAVIDIKLQALRQKALSPEGDKNDG